jgi:uncharacterized repeat protein (TIGR03803 family)
MFGTTVGGGAMHEGTLYELSPSSSGGTESILHNFPSSRNDGASPQTGVLVGRTQSHLYGSDRWLGRKHLQVVVQVMDRNLNIYGATNNAGANATGSV